MGTTISSKLCPHIQIGSDATLEAIAQLKPPMVKTMDLSDGILARIRQAAPESLIVGRLFDPDQAYVDDPARAGMSFADRYAPYLGKIDVAEVFNEAVHNDANGEKLAAFDAYQEAFARRLWEHRPDARVGLFCLPAGNFGADGEPQLTPDFFPRTFAAVSPDRGYICLHEYTWGAWNFDLGWRLERFPRQMTWAAAAGYQLLITEAGFTQAIHGGRPDDGWRRAPGMPREAVVNGYAEYDRVLARYPYVIGAAMFTIGPSYGNWHSFESLDEWKEAVRLFEPGAIKPLPARRPRRAVPRAPAALPPVELEPEDVLEKYGLKVQSPPLADFQEWWRAEWVQHYGPAENGDPPGMHNIFVDVENDGQRVNLARVMLDWEGNTGSPLSFSTDKPKPEAGGNTPLWPRQVASIWVDHDGLPSDRVSGLHTEHPDEADNVRIAHHSFRVRFVRRRKQPEQPAEQPGAGQPDLGDAFTQALRKKAMEAPIDMGTIPYAPQSGLDAYARARGLGAPLTAESGSPGRSPDFVWEGQQYRWKRYAFGIVYAPVAGQTRNLAHQLLNWSQGEIRRLSERNRAALEPA